MEEIRDAQTLEREIMDDARKRAERIIRSRDRTIEDNIEAWEKRTEETLEAAKTNSEARCKQLELQKNAALPLEKKRAFLTFVEERLSSLVRTRLDQLKSDAVTRLLARELVRAREVFGRSRVTVRTAALTEEAARTIVAGALPEVQIEGDFGTLPGRTRPCIVVAAVEGDRSMESSIGRIEEELLARHRKTLVEALLAGNTEP